MAEPYIGEIRLFAGGKVPDGWMPCEGQVMSISFNQALYSVIGAQFGGDGISVFNLPDLRGRVPLGFGPSNRVGQAAGEEAHALVPAELPPHTHPVTASSAPPQQSLIANNFWASTMSYADTPDATMAGNAISTAGASAPHNNMQPYLALSFCIAVQGLYPPHP